MNNAEYIRLMKNQRLKELKNKQKTIEDEMKTPEIDGIGGDDPEPETPPADDGRAAEPETSPAEKEGE